MRLVLLVLALTLPGSGAKLVRLDVAVQDNGQTLKGMQPSDFMLTDENFPQQIFSITEEPMDLVLLVDISSRMARDLANVGAAARSALQQLRTEDRVAVVYFAWQIFVAQPWTLDRESVARAIEHAPKDAPKIDVRGNASLEECAALFTRDQQRQRRRREILLITANKGYSQGVTEAQATIALMRAGTTLSALIKGRVRLPKQAPLSFSTGEDESDDAVVPAYVSGGEISKLIDPGKDLSAMLASLRDRYTVFFEPSPPALAGGVHRITLSLSKNASQQHPAAVVRAPYGYYVNRE